MKYAYQVEVVKKYSSYQTITERQNDIEKGIVDIILPNKNKEEKYKYSFVGIKIK